MVEQVKNNTESSKGTKDDANKIDVTLIDPEFIIGICKILTFGLTKYERGNWQRNLDPERILAALERHSLKIQQGEIIDKESGLNHSLHIGCNAMVLYFYERKNRFVNMEHNKG